MVVCECVVVQSGFFLDTASRSCKQCGTKMATPADSDSYDNCTCLVGYVMTPLSLQNKECVTCGEHRIAPETSYLNNLTLESCQCNSGYAGSNGKEIHSNFYKGCQACPAGTHKAETRLIRANPNSLCCLCVAKS